MTDRPPSHEPLAGDEELALRFRAKAVLRKRARGLRATMPASAIASRSAKIVARLGALDPVRAARAVALFHPIVERNEVDLRALDAELRARGVRVAYPSIDAPPLPRAAIDAPPLPRAAIGAAPLPRAAIEDFDAEREGPPRMTFRFVDAALATMEERGMGFLDPGPDAPEAHALDVIVVPGLQFDARGFRLGYGKGFYDRALAARPAGALAIGVAFEFQLAPDLPSTPNDVAVDLVVTDERTFTVASR
ncbi:MAG TPA: 5-formyltetrahydrofolate cyclo-ligase [Byssovorax sp.]